jgi:hypothetical protein
VCERIAPFAVSSGLVTTRGRIGCSLALLAATGCATASPGPAVPPAPVDVPTALKGCWRESVRREQPTLGIGCEDVRVIIQLGQPKLGARELVDTWRKVREAQGATTTAPVERIVDGDTLVGFASSIGAGNSELLGELQTFYRKRNGDTEWITCRSRRPPFDVERCWSVIGALGGIGARVPPRPAGVPWTVQLAGGELSLPDDCEWMQSANVFCKQGQLSWDPFATVALAESDSRAQREKQMAEGTMSLERKLDGPKPCKVMGIATQCWTSHMVFTQLLIKKQVVVAMYASVPVGDHAVAIVCSVDRKTVPEGVGPLCTQVFALGGAP